MVLLKGFGRDGFRFFTNYESRKGRELVSAGLRAGIPRSCSGAAWPLTALSCSPFPRFRMPTPSLLLSSIGSRSTGRCVRGVGRGRVSPFFPPPLRGSVGFWDSCFQVRALQVGFGCLLFLPAARGRACAKGAVRREETDAVAGCAGIGQGETVSN